MNFIEKWKTIAAMVAINFAFAVGNILVKMAFNHGLNDLVCITYRQAIATISLAPVAYFLERKSWSKLTCRLIWSLFFSALVGVTLMLYFFLTGLQYTSATYACAFANIVPVTTFIMASCFGVEKVNIKCKSGRAKVLGTLICLGGALVLTLYKGMKIIHPHAPENVVVHNSKRWGIGTMFLVMFNLTWSSWFLIQERIGKSYPFPYSTTAIISFFCAIQSTVLSFVINRNISVWILKGPLEIFTVIYAGTLGSAFCYAVMSWCVKVRGPVFTSAFSPLTEIFAAVFGASLVHEQIHLGSILGSILVIAGMYLLLWGKSDEGETCTQVEEEEKNVEDGNSEMQAKGKNTDRSTSA